LLIKTLKTLEATVARKSTKESESNKMSAKVAKVSKTSTVKTPAKAVTKATAKAAKTEPIKTPTKPVTVRLSEEDKKADTLNYILNPNTDKYVNKNTRAGQLIVEAIKNNKPIPKSKTETERLTLFVQTFQDKLNLEDSAIKDILKPIENEFTRGFPVQWGGKPKKVHAEDKPKLPCNAYIFFSRAVREKVVKTNPDLPNKEIMSIIADMWNDTPENDRVEYQELADEAKKEYEKKMIEYETKYPEKMRAKSNVGKPTKASAYHKYCEENRELIKKENPELNGKEISSVLIEQWKEIQQDKDELAKYQALADEANEDFEERIMEYYKSNRPKKLSKIEQKKADDPENFELNFKTGRYVEKSSVEKSSEKSKKTEEESEAVEAESEAVEAEAETEVVAAPPKKRKGKKAEA